MQQKMIKKKKSDEENQRKSWKFEFYSVTGLGGLKLQLVDTCVLR